MLRKRATGANRSVIGAQNNRRQQRVRDGLDSARRQAQAAHRLGKRLSSIYQVFSPSTALSSVL